MQCPLGPSPRYTTGTQLKMSIYLSSACYNIHVRLASKFASVSIEFTLNMFATRNAFIRNKMLTSHQGRVCL